jgi:N-acyl-D-aspartate/D-glutamate deacylase
MNHYHLRNAQIIDGSDSAPFLGDLLVGSDRIQAILPPLSPVREGYTVIDCTGKVLCPGFIDMHGHSDLEVLRNPPMQPKIGQGITTEVAGNCGIGVFPCQRGSVFLRELCGDVLGAYPEAGWESFNSYRQQWRSGTNMAFLQAHSTLRRTSMKGNVNRSATDTEILTMCNLLRDSLEAGCLGMSTGLYYAPCIFAEEKELLALLKVVAEYKGLFAVHMRCEGSDILDSLKEVLTLAERSGVRLEISHLKVIGRKNQHLVDEVLSMIDHARERGLDVQFDQYPYHFGSTSLFSLLPPSYLRLPREELQPLLADASVRMKIRKEMDHPQGWDSIAELCGWDQVSILSLEGNRQYEMMSLSEIAREQGSDPYEVFFDILQEAKGTALMMDVTQSEESLKKILSHPLMCFGTDALYAGALSHPRSYQSTLHLLDRYGKQEAVLPLQSLIARMTGNPANRLGLQDRGFIKTGYKADLVLLDWQHLAEHNDIKHPEITGPGISLVMVNGVVAYQEGTYFASTSGSLLLYS